jgi:hypothetical protein
MTTRRTGAILVSLTLLLAGLSFVPAAGAGAKTAGAKTAGAKTAGAKTAGWDPRIEGIAKEVAKLRKLDFEHPVPVTFLSSKEFDKKVTVDADKLSKKAKQGYAQSTGQLAALGLVPHGTDLVQSQNALQSSAVLAFYSPTKKRFFVRGTTVDSADAKVTIAHELTHALQDQHFDLTKLEEQATKTHSGDALRSLVEGDAVRIQKLYLKTLPAAQQQAYETQNASDVQQAQQGSDAADVPESLQVLLEAPYAFGDSMLQVVLAGGHESGLDDQFRDPPTNSLAYLEPTTLVDGAKFSKVSTPALRKGERRVGPADSFGAFALYLVLAQQMPVQDALRVADGWGGDAMIGYRKDGQQCVRAAFAGRNAQATTAIADGLKAWAAAQPAGSATVEPGGGRVVLSACDVAAARAAPLHDADAALVVAANRNGIVGTLMEQGAPSAAAQCTGNATVADPLFQPLLAQSAQDPTAEPDQQTITALRSRVSEIFAKCLSGSRA